jgi:hypothetical protein
MTRSYALNAVLDHYDHFTPAQVVERLRYSSFVSLSGRYMYMEVPKAACTTMKFVLRELEGAAPIKLFVGGLRETRREMFIHARRNIPLPCLLDLSDRTQKQVLESPDFLRFTVVRNPYSRLVSAWNSKVRLCEPGFEHIHARIKQHAPELGSKSLVSLREFVDYIASSCDVRTCDVHWRQQADHTFFKALNYSYVGKVESFGETLQRLRRHLRLARAPRQEAQNVSGFYADPQACNGDLADRIYKLYRADFDTFDYSRDWPQDHRRQGEGADDVKALAQSCSDEIIERNLVIGHLYEKCAQLEASLSKARTRLRKKPS